MPRIDPASSTTGMPLMWRCAMSLTTASRLVTLEATGKYYYVRQLCDTKIEPLVATFDTELLQNYAEACGWGLACEHANAGDAVANSGYLGTPGESDDALGVLSGSTRIRQNATMLRSRRAVRKKEVIAHQEA
jgi:hypothetical protein